MAKAPKGNNGPTPPEKMGFEQAVTELERIIDRIESGEVDLEASLEEYERGVKLMKRARSILKKAEQRVEELSVDDESEPAGSEAGSKEPPR